MANVVTYKEIKPADSCKYDGVSLGEVMMRLDPFDVPTARARQMRIFQGGGETNVAFHDIPAVIQAALHD